MSSGKFSASLGQSKPRGEPTTLLVAQVWVCRQPCQRRDIGANSSTTTVGHNSPTHAMNWGTFSASLEPHHDTATLPCVIPCPTYGMSLITFSACWETLCTCV